MSGTMYLVGTPIGNLGDITQRQLEILGSVDFIAAEDTRVTRGLLTHFDLHTPLVSYHEHSPEAVVSRITERLLGGESCAVVTDAGMPCISDPGAVLVSIHQNSYPEEYVKGAQVFYYTGSRQSQKLAESIQKSMVKRLDPENHRQVKANDSYYLLKKTNVPIVIAECGFLSNSAEAALLCNENYQDKTAWAICMGIMQYLNDTD